MRTLITMAIIVALAPLASAQTETPEPEAKSGLVGHLASKLSISESTAEEGSAAVLSFAKSQLGEKQFSVLSKALPEADGLLAKANGLSFGSIAELTSHLEGLGIEGGVVKSFMPAIVDYVQETSGGVKAKLLRKALSLGSET